MASITIRNLDDSIKAKLRLQAAKHGLSMEQEAREILRNSLSPSSGIEGEISFVERIRRRFATYEIEELTIPARDLHRAAPNFED